MRFHIMMRKPKDLGVWGFTFETDAAATPHELGTMLSHNHLVNGYRIAFDGSRHEMVIGKEGVASIQPKVAKEAESI